MDPTNAPGRSMAGGAAPNRRVPGRRVTELIDTVSQVFVYFSDL